MAAVAAVEAVASGAHFEADGYPIKKARLDTAIELCSGGAEKHQTFWSGH